jgi:hypothetical protein
MTKGYDLDYIWKQVDPALAKNAAGYYIQASETGGEPPGRCWGPGAKALGLEPGQIVEREPYDLLFGEGKGPDGTPLGRPPGSGQKAADIYAGLLAAEPHATAERKRELRLEASSLRHDPRSWPGPPPTAAETARNQDQLKLSGIVPCTAVSSGAVAIGRLPAGQSAVAV